MIEGDDEKDDREKPQRRPKEKDVLSSNLRSHIFFRQKLGMRRRKDTKITDSFPEEKESGVHPKTFLSSSFSRDQTFIPFFSLRVWKLSLDLSLDLSLVSSFIVSTQ
jgi:hypothetical protein